MSRIVGASRLFASIAVLGFISIFPAHAQTMQGAHIFFNEPRIPVEDFNSCVSAAANGDVDAEIRVGDAYCSVRNRPVALDYKQALYWYAKAASQNSAVGLLKLGQMHDWGLGCSKDPMLAFEFYKKAASQGLADAQYWVARDYFDGHGTPQNLQAAVDYATSAAKQGLPAAQILLAQWYLGEVGPGTNARDNISAYAWLSVAAQGDNSQSEYATQKMNEVTHGMSLSQITEAEARALSPNMLIGGPQLPQWQQDALVNSKLPKP